jgi:hypothetical protein
MATVDMATLAGTTYPSRWSGGVRTPYMVEVEVDLAEVVTAKGSAIAQGDVIEVIDLPADLVQPAQMLECQSQINMLYVS